MSGRSTNKGNIRENGIDFAEGSIGGDRGSGREARGEGRDGSAGGSVGRRNPDGPTAVSPPPKLLAAARVVPSSGLRKLAKRPRWLLPGGHPASVFFAGLAGGIELPPANSLDAPR